MRSSIGRRALRRDPAGGLPPAEPALVGPPRSPATCHSSTPSFSPCSTSRFPNRLPQDEDEFEPSKVEIEAARSVLPHRRCGSVMMPYEDDRVDRLKRLREDVQHSKPGGSVDPTAVLVCNDPREDSSGYQDATRLRRDPSHLFVEPRIPARNPSETSRITTIRDVVRVR